MRERACILLLLWIVKVEYKPLTLQLAKIVGASGELELKLELELELRYLMPERNLKFLMSVALLDALRALSKTQSFGLLP